MTDNDSKDVGFEPPNEALRSLPTEAEPSGDLWPEIESRLGTPASAESRPAARARAEQRLVASVSADSRDARRSGFRRPWLQAAAAVALFAAGAASGLGRTPESKLPASSMDEALALAAEVQRTGSEYVAALAAFTSVVDSLSSDVRGQGTSAAFAALYSAADQLAGLSLSDPRATTIEATTESTVETNEVGSPERRVRF